MTAWEASRRATEIYADLKNTANVKTVSLMRA